MHIDKHIHQVVADPGYVDKRKPKGVVSLRNIVAVTATISLMGLFFGSGSGVMTSGLSLGVSVGVVAIRKIQTRKILSYTNTVESRDLTNKGRSNNILTKLYNASVKAHIEKWGGTDHGSDAFIMLKTSLQDNTCLEFNVIQKTIIENPCNGLDKQRWKISTQGLESTAGYCLTPPDSYNTFKIGTGNTPNTPCSCKIKLQSCNFRNKSRGLYEYEDHHLHINNKYIFIQRNSKHACYIDRSTIDYLSRHDRNLFNKFGEHSQLLPFNPERVIESVNPVRIKEAVQYPLICNEEALYTFYLQHTLFGLLKPKLPSKTIENQHFPVILPQDIMSVKKDFIFDMEYTARYVNNGFNQGPKNVRFTGLYAAPGETVNVKIKLVKINQICNPKDINVELLINLHSSPGNCGPGNPKNYLLRPPTLEYKSLLSSGISQHRTAYGGTIAMSSSVSRPCKLLVSVEGAYEAPHLNLLNQRFAKINPNNTSPWSVLEGKRVTTVLPTIHAAKFNHPELYMKMADKMATQSLRLWGYDIDKKTKDVYHESGNRNTIVVSDIQHMYGVAHYTTSFEDPYVVLTNKLPIIDMIYAQANRRTLPIQLSHDCFLALQTLPHELGHTLHPNTMHKSLGKEILADITAEYAMNKLFHKSILSSQQYLDTLKKINQGTGFYDFDESDMSQSRMKLVFLLQIINVSPKKWKLFTDIARHYRSLATEQSEVIINKSNQEQIDYFFEVTCNIMGYNIVDHFNAWHLKISQKSIKNVNHLPVPPASFFRSPFRLASEIKFSNKNNYFSDNQSVNILTISNKKINKSVSGCHTIDSLYHECETSFSKISSLDDVLILSLFSIIVLGYSIYEINFNEKPKITNHKVKSL